MIPGNAHFKIWFKNGGCHRFLKVFHDILERMREHIQSKNKPQNLNYLNQFGSGNFQNQYVAFSDTNDPSTLFLTQPPVQNYQQNQNNNYLNQYINDMNFQPNQNPQQPPIMH